ncbi:prevent-host-death family protein [Neorhizobium tomejilense]|uniref:prevent-host-death family protein n=1 Tax=Neorhizobium tomejilense TaxID=2093828 RepID=UPI003ED02285
MKVLVEIAETFDRFEELFERGDEILICRDGTPIIKMKPIPKGPDPGEKLSALMVEGRTTVPASSTSNHDDFYDEHGLPK